MKIKFNHFERVAGLFVGGAVIGSLVVAVGVAIKRGWFASKVHYQTMMKSADGIHPGTVVQISGLRAGSVEDVELIGADQVLVRFSVLEKFQPQIRRDSEVQVLRPFVIGEKVLEISVGSGIEPTAEPGSELKLGSTFDVMDLVSGRKIGPFLGTIERLSENLRLLGEAFADPERTRALVKMFDRLQPLLKNINDMAIGVAKITDIATRQKRFELLIGNMVTISQELGQVMPAMAAEAPDLGRQLGQVIKNLNVLTAEMQKLTPAIAAVAPELPKASLRAVEALNETVVLLKAMQKSFLFKGKIEEVKKEERQPASDTNR